MVSRRLAAGRRSRRRRRAGRAGPHRALPRPVQLRLLARGLRRHLSAAPAQRRLPAPDRRRQPAGPGGRGRPEPWVEATAERLQFRRPARKCSWPTTSWSALLAPSRGGQLYELDVRVDLPQPAGHAHPPARGLSPQGPGRRQRRQRQRAPASTTAWSSSRQGLDQRLQYDDYPAQEPDGPLLRQRRHARRPWPPARRRAGRFRRRRSTRPASAAIPTASRCSSAAKAPPAAMPLRITKGITLDAGSSTLEIAYLLEGLPRRPAAALRRRVQFRRPARRAPTTATSTTPSSTAWASSARRLDLRRRHGLGPGRRVAGHRRGPEDLAAHEPLDLPIETVSQSEGGFELVHQSVVVQPHWIVMPDAEGRWSVTMHLAIDTSRAEQRHAERPALATAT